MVDTLSIIYCIVCCNNYIIYYSVVICKVFMELNEIVSDGHVNK